MSNNKTPEDLAKEFSKFDVATDIGSDLGSYRQGLFEGYLAGYKAGFEIGCMKGSMAMQWTLDDDYHFTPMIDHEKLARLMGKKEMKDE